jgi:hypothetical protein
VLGFRRINLSRIRQRLGNLEWGGWGGGRGNNSHRHLEKNISRWEIGKKMRNIKKN